MAEIWTRTAGSIESKKTVEMWRRDANVTTTTIDFSAHGRTDIELLIVAKTNPGEAELATLISR